jgi:hypothetical protein
LIEDNKKFYHRKQIWAEWAEKTVPSKATVSEDLETF